MKKVLYILGQLDDDDIEWMIDTGSVEPIAKDHRHDPGAMEATSRIYPDQPGLTLCNSTHEALEGADALVIITEWQEFRSPDYEVIRDALADAVIFDGRNLYEPEMMEQFGLDYYAIGRGSTPGALTQKYSRRKTDRAQE